MCYIAYYYLYIYIQSLNKKLFYCLLDIKVLCTCTLNVLVAAYAAAEAAAETAAALWHCLWLPLLCRPMAQPKQLCCCSSLQTGWLWLNTGPCLQWRATWLLRATPAAASHCCHAELGRRLRTHFVLRMFQWPCYIPSCITKVYTIFMWLYTFFILLVI